MEHVHYMCYVNYMYYVHYVKFVQLLFQDTCYLLCGNSPIICSVVVVILVVMNLAC